jgi:hypothetical protein
MVRPELTERTHSVYFQSPEEKLEWENFAKESKVSLSKYILEMARRGKEDRQESSRNYAEELRKLRDENNRLRDDYKLLSMLRERNETELFKLKHSLFLPDNFQGERSFAPELRDILRQGGFWTGHELLKSLKIDPKDSEAVQIVHRQLKLLQDYKVVREEERGWRWIA